MDETAADIIMKAEQMDIRLRNSDDSEIDPYMLYLTGKASSEKMDIAGVDPNKKARMTVIVSEIQKRKEELRKKTNPSLTEEQITELFEKWRKSLQVQQQLEDKGIWVIIASLAWNGYSHDGHGILYLNGIPPIRARYVTLEEGKTPPANMKMLYEGVGEYDPSKEVMVAVSVAEQVYPFRLSQEPYPPKAFQMRKHVFQK